MALHDCACALLLEIFATDQTKYVPANWKLRLKKGTQHRPVGFLHLLLLRRASSDAESIVALPCFHLFERHDKSQMNRAVTLCMKMTQFFAQDVMLPLRSGGFLQPSETVSIANYCEEVHIVAPNA